MLPNFRPEPGAATLQCHDQSKIEHLIANLGKNAKSDSHDHFLNESALSNDPSFESCVESDA